MSEQEKNVFKLEKPKDFQELVNQVETISEEIEIWLNKLYNAITVALDHSEFISEDQVNDAFHNISQNIIELSKLIQKKVRGE
ncbi:MAG: hypothetical protein ACFFDF_25585 [Candidatus Odinarchaeota archaeon]